MQCPACRGSGGETEVVLDFGQGPWYPCGYCKGKGTLTHRQFYKVLGYVSASKRWEKRLRKRRPHTRTTAQ